MMREFFYLQKSDRKVVLALLAVIVIALGVIFLTGQSKQPNTASSSNQLSKPSAPSLPTRKVERFPFDPNTADSTQLLRLGLQPWQVRNI